MSMQDGRFEKGQIPHNKKPPEYRECPWCRTLFLLPRKNPSTRYCSRECGYLARRGRPNTAEHNKNISLNHSRYWLGKKQSPEHVAKAVANLVGTQHGEKHWNWKGGITSIYKKYRCTAQYREWRTAVFMRDNFTCVQCHQRGGVLNADHYPIAYAAIINSRDWALLDDINNGRTLCINCHKKTSNYGIRGKALKRQMVAA